MPNESKDIIEWRRYDLAIDFPVLVLSGDKWKISDKKADTEHFHDCYEIGVCHSETSVIEFYNKPVEFSAGDISFIPPNIPHTTYSTPGKSSKWSYIFFNPDFFLNKDLLLEFKTNMSINPDSTPFLHLNKTDHGKVYSLIMEIINEVMNKRDFYETSTLNLLALLCIEINRLYSKEKNNKTNNNTQTNGNKTLIISPALGYIQKNYTKEISTEELAEKCHFSPTHFRRVFKSIMGISPLQYINFIRVSESCNLLSTTDNSILSIAENVGFSSISTYNRSFKSFLGMAPNEYRKRIRRLNHTHQQKIIEYNGFQ